MTYTQQTDNNITYDNSGVLQFFNNVYYDLNDINNNNLIDEGNAKRNLYNYKKTKAYIYVLYIIIITCLIVLFLTFLRKNVNYFDDKAYLMIVSISIGIAVCYIFYILWDILFRDNINFDEYNFSRYGSIPQITPGLPNPVIDYTNVLDISGSKCKNKNGSTISSFF